MFQPGISVAGSRHQDVHLVLQMILWIGQTLIKDVLGALRPGWMLGGVRKGRRDDLGNLQAEAPPFWTLSGRTRQSLPRNGHGDTHQGLRERGPKELGGVSGSVCCCKMSEEIMAANVPISMEGIRF